MKHIISLGIFTTLFISNNDASKNGIFNGDQFSSGFGGSNFLSAVNTGPSRGNAFSVFDPVDKLPITKKNDPRGYSTKKDPYYSDPYYTDPYKKTDSDPYYTEPKKQSYSDPYKGFSVPDPNKGTEGLYGITGPKGEKGDRGYPGADGLDGAPGKKGEPGKPGVMKNGDKGDKGDRGKPGKNGLNGKPGQPGKPGKNGVPGKQGPPGTPGKNGKQGEPGAKGDKGKPGKKGPIGYPGPPGKKKVKGPPGYPGPPGPPGKCLPCNGGKKSNIYSQPKRGVDIYDLGNNGYGTGKGLSGDANYNDGYQQYVDPNLPKKYDDGYNYKDNAGYGVTLPNQYSGGKGFGIGSLIGQVPAKKLRKDDEEEKKFAKAKEAETMGDLKLKTETKLKKDGYNDELAYAGAEIFEDAAAKEQKYKKGEAFLVEAEDAFKKESAYGGDAIYQNDNVQTDASVGFVVDHSLKFRNDFADENHRGKYKGDEFDVNYKATDVEGSYKNNELDRKKKAAAYQGIDANGEFNQNGKFFEDDLYIDDERDRDFYFKAKGKGTPEGYVPKYPGISEYDNGYGNGGEYGNEYGDKKGFGGPGGYGPGGYEPNPPYGERYKVRESAEKDDKYRGFGNNFDAKDAFAKKEDVELYSGAEESIKEKSAFDKGTYRDVNAKGANKFASYAGDYQTNKKAQDVDFKVMHNEDLKQNLNQDVKSDIYFAKYNGQDLKKARDAEQKFGQYTDAEKVRKQDAFINAKKYNGNDFSNDIKVENEQDIYLSARKEAEKKKELEAKPAGYRGERGYYRPKKNDGYDDDYSSQRSRGSYRGDPKKVDYGKKDDYYGRLSNGQYGYRRMLLDEDNEINELKTQLNDLQITTIIGYKEIITLVGALIIASILGSSVFIVILRSMDNKRNIKINN